MTTEIRSISEIVIEIVRESGDIIKNAFNQEKNIRHKGSIDLVTDTDFSVEDFLKANLKDVVPGATFLAEESAESYDLDECCWVIDPLDGTTNFAHSFPFVATSVALWKDGRVVLGVVNAPMLGELFHAVEGEGAYLNGTRINVSDASLLQQSLLATGFPYDIEKYCDQILNHLRNALLQTRGIRRPGAAAIDLAYVACGRYDGFYEYALKPWDTAAGILLVQEAGGRVSSFNPNGHYTPGDETIAVSNGHIHDQLLDLLEL